MNHINKLDSLPKDQPQLMTHLIYGYPSVESSLVIAQAMERGGSSILEIQLPFSDPIADGETIVKACQDALQTPKPLQKYVDFIAQVSKVVNLPIVVMSYVNPILHHGIEKFVAEAARAGVSAIILADLPFDTLEGKQFVAACKKENVHPILILSPGVPIKRLTSLVGQSSGFIYCTSKQGTTGANSMFDTNLASFIKSLKSLTDTPIAIGFGVKDHQDVKKLSAISNIVVAGSVFIKAIQGVAEKDIAAVIRKKVESLDSKAQ